MITIDSIVYQRPISLTQKYEFTLTYTDGEETKVLPAEVIVSHAEGKTTIDGIIVEGLPEEFNDAWDPEWALKQIQFELGGELQKITKAGETF
jgi:hypothetical protein